MMQHTAAQALLAFAAGKACLFTYLSLLLPCVAAVFRGALGLAILSLAELLPNALLLGVFIHRAFACSLLLEGASCMLAYVKWRHQRIATHSASQKLRFCGGSCKHGARGLRPSPLLPLAPAAAAAAAGLQACCLQRCSVFVHAFPLQIGVPLCLGLHDCWTGLP
jgi:hypothetical protein